MGADRNYLALELSADGDPERVETDLTTGDTFDEGVSTVNDNLIAVGTGGDRQPAMKQLQTVAHFVSRALLVHVYDTTMTGVGYFYERHDDELVLVDRTEGAERYGIDVVDYYRRELDFDGPR